MTATTASWMLYTVPNVVAPMLARLCAYSAPPSPATNPASTNAFTLARPAFTVNARAFSSLSRTATSTRPRPLRRTLRTISIDIRRMASANR